jgi:hypothetical protein
MTNRESEMRQYEYLSMRIDFSTGMVLGSDGPDGGPLHINHFGKEGWKLVHYEPSIRVPTVGEGLFMREIETYIPCELSEVVEPIKSKTGRKSKKGASNEEAL